MSGSRIESIWHGCYVLHDHQEQWSGQRPEREMWVWELAVSGRGWREVTRNNSLSVFVRFSSLLPGLVWSCFNFSTTKEGRIFSQEGRIFSHPGLMEEILLARDTIQIKYALRRTVRICTKESRGSCLTMNIWNQGHFFPPWGKWKHRTTWKTSKIYWKETPGYKVELLVWKVVFFLCKWVLCPKRTEQGTFVG